MKNHRLFAGLIVCGIVLNAPSLVRAEEPTPSTGTSQWSVLVGVFDPKEVSGPMASEIGSGMLAAAAGFRISEHLRFEVDLAAYGRRYDTLPSMPAFLTSTDSTFNVNSAGISAMVKAPLPAGGVNWYVAGGLGLFTTTAVVTGSTAGVSGSFQVIDRGVGAQVALGGDVDINKYISLGLELRALGLKADLGPISQGKADVGGGVLALAVRGYF
jgi:hypothetical protein